MLKVQRQFGKFMPRTADETHVSVLLKDFEEADKMLTRIIDASKAWRDAWIAILTYQHALVNEFANMYAPIVGAADSYNGPAGYDTPQSTLERTAKLREEYEDLKRDLLEEVNSVDEKMIKPLMEAKEYLQPMKKTIKKREDRKLDFERYQGRVDTSKKKMKRTDRENAALVQAESNLARATEEYEAADGNLRGILPGLIQASFSLLPPILATQIRTQNTLLAHYYTMLHTYCEDSKFPSPPPPMAEVIRAWTDDFKPVQREAESIACIASGKAIRTRMEMDDHRNGSTNGSYSRRPSGQSTSRKPSVSPARNLPPSPAIGPKPKIAALPSPSATALLSPTDPSPGPSLTTSISAQPQPSEYHTPMSTTPSMSYASFSPAGPHTDYFTRDRQPSSTSISSAVTTATTSSVIAAKKKPPPPPPRMPSTQIWVTALYDFSGQSSGDLVFREGDRIRVTKKTQSTDDWWEGELRGTKGAFPANYCE